MQTESKPIDVALRQYLDQQAAGSINLAALPNPDRVRMVRQMMEGARANRPEIPGLPNGLEVRDLEIAPGLLVRLYAPYKAPQPSPLLVYLHGGGWVAGSVATADPFCRFLTNAAGLRIASVEYRRAPEHPYPAALDDIVATISWFAEHAAEWGGDSKQLCLGGDSAGANLAAVIANRMCAVSGTPPLRALLLLYPVMDHPSAAHPSYAQNSTGYGLEAESMRWFWNQYAPDVSPDDPAISPLRSQTIPILPPTLITTAEYDVLRDEGIAYAEKLQAGGVPVTHWHSPDMHHNFPISPGTVARFPQCDLAVGAIAKWLQTTLGVESISRASGLM